VKVPKVSIIVPVYKTEKFLAECVDSILGQTFPDFEVILVNDCSPDNSPQMCEEYAKRDARVKVVHNEKNQGLVKTRQVGLKHSSCDYIQFVDSDDYIELNMTERLYNKAISEDFDIVNCDVVRFDDDKLSPSLPFDIRGKSKTEIVINMIEDNFRGYLVNRLIKRHLFNNVVWPDFALREDAVTSIQLYLNGEKFGYEHSILYHYRFNENSISSDNKNRYRLINDVYRNFEKLDKTLQSRSDYHIYKPALMKMLDLYKTRDRFKPYYYMKRFFMSFVPYGFIVAYRDFAFHNIKKFLSLFVPYGIIVIYNRKKRR
jgi:glycosyltransferase involved in cell wall biosynthesis